MHLTSTILLTQSNISTFNKHTFRFSLEFSLFVCRKLRKSAKNSRIAVPILTNDGAERGMGLQCSVFGVTNSLVTQKAVKNAKAKQFVMSNTEIDP